MPARTCHLLLCLLMLAAVMLAAAARAALGADRFVANRANGERIGNSRFAMWPVPGAPNRWGDQDLLDSDNPVRLVRDRQASVELRPPFLVLANGDVLTGAAVGIDGDGGREDAAPRVKVQLEGILPVSGTGVSVRTDRILRIVGSAEASVRESPPPGTVELTGGRRIAARSIKWREYGLAMLTAEGIVEANYAEIVDAVFPGIDRTAAVLDDNLWAGDTSRGTIVRFQLAGGAIITASRISREQERSRRRNRSGVEVATYYYAQPAWSDQPLALPEVEIAWCGYRSANQAPLSLLPAELLASRRYVGSGAAGGDQLPASGEIESDVAIRTHAHSEIAFDLPAGAKSLSTVVGLDRAVGGGGCVRCRIVAEKPGGRVLWDSGVIVGSDGPRPTGPLDVAGLARIVLITEAAHDERPPGADPLDIRDLVAWLAPLVEIDLVHERRLPVVLAGLEHWQLSGDGLSAAHLTSEWNPRQQTWDPVLALPKDQPLVLTRKLRVTHAGDIVDLRTACPDELDEHLFELSVNGRPLDFVASTDRAEQRKRLHAYGRQRLRYEDETAAVTDRLAYWWDLQSWRGQDVTLVLSLRGRRERNEVAWRGIAVRSAIVNLPESGRPLACDVSLAGVKPQSVKSARTAPAIGRLPGNPREDRTIRFLGQAYSGGYGLMRDSTITFPLAPEYKRFVAVAGCTHQVAGPMRVLIDGQVAWERSLMLGLAQAEQIDVAIPAGAKSLTLVLGKDGSPYGYAAFAEAGFITK
jgi:hypothetical protein